MTEIFNHFTEGLSDDIDWRTIISEYVMSKEKRVLTTQERAALQAVLLSVAEKKTHLPAADIYLGQVLLKLNQLLSNIKLEIKYPIVDGDSPVCKDDLHTLSLLQQYLIDIQFVEMLRAQLPLLSVILASR